jgi:hypothetical protein
MSFAIVTSKGIGDAEAGAMIGGGLHGGDGRGMRVAEDGRAPSEDVVNQLVAVHGPDAGTSGAVDEEGLSADAAKGAHGGVDAAGDDT